MCSWLDSLLRVKEVVNRLRPGTRSSAGNKRSLLKTFNLAGGSQGRRLDAIQQNRKSYFARSHSGPFYARLAVSGRSAKRLSSAAIPELKGLSIAQRVHGARNSTKGVPGFKSSKPACSEMYLKFTHSCQRLIPSFSGRKPCDPRSVRFEGSSAHLTLCAWIQLRVWICALDRKVHSDLALVLHLVPSSRGLKCGHVRLSRR